MLSLQMVFTSCGGEIIALTVLLHDKPVPALNIIFSEHKTKFQLLACRRKFHFNTCGGPTLFRVEAGLVTHL